MCSHHHGSELMPLHYQVARMGATVFHGNVELRDKGFVMLCLHEKVGHTQYRAGCWNSSLNPRQVRVKRSEKMHSGVVPVTGSNFFNK